MKKSQNVTTRWTSSKLAGRYGDICVYVHAQTLKQLLKKVGNNKLSSDSVYYAKSNVFQCFNSCKKVRGCKIFNFNPKKELCQLTDQNIDRSYENAVKADAWEVYIKTDDVSYLKKCLHIVC